MNAHKKHIVTAWTIAILSAVGMYYCTQYLQTDGKIIYGHQITILLMLICSSICVGMVVIAIEWMINKHKY